MFLFAIAIEQSQNTRMRVECTRARARSLSPEKVPGHLGNPEKDAEHPDQGLHHPRRLAGHSLLVQVLSGSRKFVDTCYCCFEAKDGRKQAIVLNVEPQPQQKLSMRFGAGRNHVPERQTRAGCDERKIREGKGKGKGREGKGRSPLLPSSERRKAMRAVCRARFRCYTSSVVRLFCPILFSRYSELCAGFNAPPGLAEESTH